MLKNKKTKKVIILVAVVALILVLGAYYFLSNQNNSEKTAEDSDQSQQQPDINFDPPTPEDVQRTEANKEKIIQDKQNSTGGQAPPSGKKSVKPTITYAGQYGDKVEAGAYVSGVFEEFGVCKAIFQKGSEIMNVQVEAVRGANSMDCPVMSVPVNELRQKGSWSVTVSYSSSTADGVSDSRQIEVN
ncbi:MAG: hypothetical protein ACR2FM_00225 [Candidatus Saccharimonadales bacterium]